MFSDFPNLHPLVVHFPIVLILLGAALQVLLVFKDTPSLRWGTLVILGLAFVSALVASKVFHAHPAELPAGAQALFLEHEKYAAYTLWISGLAFVLRGIGNYYQIHRRSYETLVLASALVSAVFLSLAGHRGAQLVYVEGVGPKGHLVVREGQDHGEHAAGMPPAAPGGGGAHAGHPGSQGDAHGHHPSQPGRQTQAPIGHQGHAAGRHPGASQEAHPMPEKGQPAPSHTATGQAAHEGMAGHEKMPGRQHPVTHQPGKDHAGGHPTSPAGQSKKGEGMAGMDHSPGKASPSKKDLAGHAAMGHGPTHPQAPQPAGISQPGQDHGAMPATGDHQQAGHAPGHSTRTDAYGRPLIHPAEPYDNNPAREQSQRHSNRN